MPVTALKCKECGETYDLEAIYVCERCFGPLEVLYDLTVEFFFEAEETRYALENPRSASAVY